MESLLSQVVQPMPRRPPQDRASVLLAFVAGSVLASTLTLAWLGFRGLLVW